MPDRKSTIEHLADLHTKRVHHRDIEHLVNEVRQVLAKYWMANEGWTGKTKAIAGYLKVKSAGSPPELPGVYGLWRGEECLYIGCSKNLARRLTASHERWAECPCAHAEWAICHNYVEVEQWLIAGIHPVMNGGGRAPLDITVKYEKLRTSAPPEPSIDERFLSAWGGIFGVEDWRLMCKRTELRGMS